jgi:signal peptidase
MSRARRAAAAGLQFLAVAYLTVVAGLLFWSHAPQAIGWHPRVVLTGSMLPVIRPGDVSVIGPAAVGPITLPKGRVVLVRDESMRSGFYLHRVVGYDAAGRVVTKGDANRTADSEHVPADAIRGQLRLVVPVVGLPVVWLQNDRYVPLLVTGALTWSGLIVLLGGRRPESSVA